MVKYAVFLISLGCLQLTASEHEPAPICLQIYNKVKGDVFLCQMSKYYVQRYSMSKQYVEELEWYKKEDFNLFDGQCFTTNIRWDTSGNLDFKFADQKRDEEPILALIYYWDSQRNKLDLHWYKKHSDGQKITLDAQDHTYVAFVLKGENVEDSYFYHERMHEND